MSTEDQKAKLKRQSEQTNQAAEPQRSATQAEKLLDLVQGLSVELFCDEEHTCWASCATGDGRTAIAIKSPSFRHWLYARYYDVHGVPPGAHAVAEVVETLCGQAICGGVTQDVHVRLAGDDDRVYLDLGNESHQVVQIDSEGWRIVNHCPWHFRRPNGLKALPRPESGGSVAELREVINVSDQQWPLVATWLVMAFMPRGPYPILAIHGEQGSAKSTTSRLLRRLIDPAKGGLRAEPVKPQDLMITASNARVAAFDNLSGVPPWLSDALCRLSTGGGFSTRLLYSDGDEKIFEAARPILANGINELSRRSDLLDRSLVVTLPHIPAECRRTEREVIEQFDAVAPRVLGALLTAVSQALRDVGQVELAERPRMADFAEVAVAAETALGLQSGDFLTAYQYNRDSANELALEANPVADAVLQLAQTNEPWIGTPTELLATLAGCKPELTGQRDWPKAANSLSNKLKRLAPNLREQMINVEIKQAGSGNDRKRVIEIRRLEKTVPVVPAVPHEESSSESPQLSHPGESSHWDNTSPEPDDRGTAPDPSLELDSRVLGALDDRDGRDDLPVTSPKAGERGWKGLE